MKAFKKYESIYEWLRSQCFITISSSFFAESIFEGAKIYFILSYQISPGVWESTIPIVQ